MALPQKQRYFLEEAAEELNVGVSQIKEWLSDSLLQAQAYYPEEDQWLVVDTEAIRRAAGTRSKIRTTFVVFATDKDGPYKETILAAEPEFLNFSQLAISAAALNRFKKRNTFEHSDDYSVVKWRGERYEFTVHQGKVIKYLHEQLSNGEAEPVPQSKILNSIEFEGDQRIDKIFRSRSGVHPAINSLLLREGRGRYRLNL